MRHAEARGSCGGRIRILGAKTAGFYDTNGKDITTRRTQSTEKKGVEDIVQSPVHERDGKE